MGGESVETGPSEVPAGEIHRSGAASDSLFEDAATRVSRPSAFDEWYYGIEDKLGQGTVGMGVCFLIFVLVLVFAAVFAPI